MGLSERQMDRRIALNELWAAGYLYAGGPKGDKRAGISALAHVFFAKFLSRWHPDLALNREETALVEMMGSPVPDELSLEIEARLPTTSSETGVPPAPLRAIVHGLATAPGPGFNDVRTLLRDAALVLLTESESDASTAHRAGIR
jgi:hypothetical protein